MDTFARDIALYETRKLPMPNSWDLWRENPGWPVHEDFIREFYLDYRRDHIWPEPGGRANQDTHLVEAFQLMDDQVEWNKANNAKRNLQSGRDLYRKRRERLRGNR